MDIDTNEFFRQATMRICGSLDIETAMWNALEYLENFMPITGMNLVLGEPGMPGIEALAQVSRYKIEKLGRIIPLPPEIRSEVESYWASLNDVIIVNNPWMFPTMLKVNRLINVPDMSNMVLRLKIQDKRLFALVIYLAGSGQYKSEHARLLSLLHDPFAIATSNALRHQEVLKLKEMLADDNRFLYQEMLRISGDEIIGKDAGLKQVFDMVRQVAPINIPVLLLGETGVGKEIIANAIHYSSPRKNQPFIKVNCGAIPDTLIDSELFGHEKGAFTGALFQKRGRFERAHKGTILLDEIGELPQEAQVRLLRVLQNKEIERVGGTMPVPIDVRIIAATNRDLKNMVISSRFREDLWFRLNVFPIKIPPLRERRDDISELVYYFINRKSIERNISPPPTVEPGAIDQLKAYSWPGNVRELENYVERILIKYQGQNISGPLTFEDAITPKADHDSPGLSSNDYEPSQFDKIISIQVKQIVDMVLNMIDLLQIKREPRKFPGNNYDSSGVDHILPEHLDQILKNSLEKIHLPQAEQKSPAFPADNRYFLKLEEAMSLHIQEALEITEGKINGPGGAAELLDVNPNTLRSKMRKLGLFRERIFRSSIKKAGGLNRNN